jgi:hypothetical protein
VPTSDQFKTLTNSFENPDFELVSTGSSGFDVLYGGYGLRTKNNTEAPPDYTGLGSMILFWTQTFSRDSDYIFVSFSPGYVTYELSKPYLCYVRCIKDE